MRRAIKSALSVVFATMLTITGILPLGNLGGVPVAKAVGEVYKGNGVTDTTVYGGSCDDNYCQTHGTSDQHKNMWDNGVLTTISNGDKALFKSVEIGNDYHSLRGIIFRYSKPHNHNVNVRIRLDSENGQIVGDFGLNKQTSSLDDFTTQTCTNINANNIHGTHDIYLEFSTSYSSVTNTTAMDLSCMIFGATNDYTEYNGYDPYDEATAYNKAYRNNSNKNKPYYYADYSDKEAMILVRHKNQFGQDRFVFANHFAVSHYRANVCKINGLSYNYSNNTLTLSNFKQKDYQIICQNMGKAFKIKLEGKNEVQHFECWGNKWPCGMHFTGNGSLEINKVKEPENGLYLVSWYKNGLQIDAKTKITAYAAKKNNPVVLEFGEGTPAKKDMVKIKFDKKNKKLKGKFVAGPKRSYTKVFVYNKSKFEKK